MRCPKCSYISFDMLEKCVKCGKKIGEAAAELEGTVASPQPPSFLRMAGGEVQPEGFGESTEVATEEPLDLGEVGEESMEISLDEGPSMETEAAEMEIDLGEAEVGGEEMPEIDLGGEEVAAEEEAPESEIDFGLGEEAEEDTAIGISDLAPSEEAGEEIDVAAEEAEQIGAAAAEGLEDLEVEGIDLESGPGADTDKVMPSVKTGTALDDFDIDLGDLLPKKD